LLLIILRQNNFFYAKIIFLRQNVFYAKLFFTPKFFLSQNNFFTPKLFFYAKKKILRKINFLRLIIFITQKSVTIYGYRQSFLYFSISYLAQMFQEQQMKWP